MRTRLSLVTVILILWSVAGAWAKGGLRPDFGAYVGWSRGVGGNYGEYHGGHVTYVNTLNVNFGLYLQFWLSPGFALAVEFANQSGREVEDFYYFGLPPSHTETSFVTSSIFVNGVFKPAKNKGNYRFLQVGLGYGLTEELIEGQVGAGFKTALKRGRRGPKLCLALFYHAGLNEDSILFPYLSFRVGVEI